MAAFECLDVAGHVVGGLPANVVGGLPAKPRDCSQPNYRRNGTVDRSGRLRTLSFSSELGISSSGRIHI
jgi:hypothetical protein